MLHLSLVDGSGCQKCSQLCPWFAFLLSLLHCVVQRRLAKLDGKLTHCKPPQNPKPYLFPLISPVIKSNTSKGTGAWSRDKPLEGMQAAGSARNLQLHRIKWNVEFLR